MFCVSLISVDALASVCLLLLSRKLLDSDGQLLGPGCAKPTKKEILGISIDNFAEEKTYEPLKADLLHLSHFYLESLDLGVQLLEPAQVCLSEGGHLLQGCVPDDGQPIFVRLLAVIR